MKKDELISSLQALLERTTALEGKMLAAVGGMVFTKATRAEAEAISRMWFEGLDNILPGYGVHEGAVAKYRALFDRLLALALKASWRKSYIKVMDEIRLDFRSDLVAPVIKYAGEPKSALNLDAVLEAATVDEREYLVEALGCAERGYYRASVVLAWSAAADRMHRVVEKLGVAEFNRKSAAAKAKKTGRFARFNKEFNVGSLSELSATVFDNDLLWVLEFWGLIDANQHERLQFCFTMRNNAAHPGEAPITSENLASFYSDLDQMVFKNPKFVLS